jgi:hypothetical protein
MRTRDLLVFPIGRPEAMKNTGWHRGCTTSSGRKRMKIVMSALIGSLLAVVTLTACERGPMEKAGEKVDKAVDELKK